MAAPVILVEATPRRASDGASVTVRLAGAGASVPYHYGKQHWRAGLTGLPKTSASLDFDGEQLGGGGVAQSMEISWAPSTKAGLAELAELYWADAPITVRVGPEGSEMPPILTTGLGLESAVNRGVLTIALADQAVDLKRPVLVDRFLGTGGLEGPTEFADSIKSRAWGRCFNVPGRQLDGANNIWVFGDPRRRWQAIDQVRDKGAITDPATMTLLAWQGTAEATFAALQATAAIEGGGVLCPSIACVKWWTPPYGDLHADIRGEIEGGYVETAPEIMARIAAARSTIPFAPGAIAAAAASRSAPFGWRIDTDSATAASEISEMLGGVSTSWLLIDGAIVFRHWDWTAPTRVARSFAVTRKSSVKPTASRKLGYRRNWAPMARGDLAAIVLSTDVLYEDGTPIEDLKPATPGATAGAPDGTSIGGAVQPDGSIVGGLPAKVTIDALAQLAGTPSPGAIIAGAKALVDRARSTVASQLAAQLLGEDRKARYERLLHLDGVELTTRVVHEITERIDGDAAIVERVDLIEATASDGIEAAQASIREEARVRAEADSAETSQREQAISTVVASVDGERVAREAAIVRVETTAASDLAAATTQLELAISTVEIAVGDERVAREASIASERTTSANELAAETSERTAAVSAVTLLVDGERVAREASIATERSTSATELAAETSEREAAVSAVTLLVDGERLAREAAITAERSTSASEIAAETLQRDAAISTVETLVDGERVAREAAIVGERTTSADALSAATSQLEAAVSAVEVLIGGERQAREAAISEERTTSADETSAVAQLVTNLASRVGDSEASITFLLETSNGEQAVAQLSVNVNGQITGFKINGQESLFTIAADRFVIGNSQIFEVDTLTGVVRMKNAVIGTANIDTLNLKAGSVTSLSSFAFPDQAVGSFEVTLAEVVNTVIGDGVDGQALAMVSFTQDGSTTVDTSQRIRAYVDVGNGYVEVRNKVQGIAVASGQARWILSQSFPVSLMGAGAVSLKVTAQGNSLGGGPAYGSYARDIQIDIFRGAR